MEANIWGGGLYTGGIYFGRNFRSVRSKGYARKTVSLGRVLASDIKKTSKKETFASEIHETGHVKYRGQNKTTNSKTGMFYVKSLIQLFTMSSHSNKLSCP